MMYGRRPLTRLESALYAAVCAVLVAVFFKFALDYMELAERAAMQATLNGVTSAINLRYARSVMLGQAADPEDFLRRNPFKAAETTPRSFAGELISPEIGSLERPAWFYDVISREVVYLPNHRRSLQTVDPDAALRFRLAPHRAGFGFMLVPASPYTWE